MGWTKSKSGCKWHSYWTNTRAHPTRPRHYNTNSRVGVGSDGRVCAGAPRQHCKPILSRVGPCPPRRPARRPTSLGALPAGFCSFAPFILRTRKLGWDIQPAWVGPHCDQPGSPVAATPAGRLKAEGQAGPGTSTDPRDLLGQPGCRPAAREPGLNCGDHNSIHNLIPTIQSLPNVFGLNCRLNCTTISEGRVSGDHLLR